MGEKAHDGTTSWAENPPHLEDRNSLAKVIRSKECRNGSMTVGSLRRFHTRDFNSAVSATVFAQAVYTFVSGEPSHAGFRPSSDVCRSSRITFGPASRLPRDRFTA